MLSQVSLLILQPSFSLGNVYSLFAGLVYPFNVTPVAENSVNSNVANDFTRAFGEAQFIASQRVHRSWLSPLFELWSDKTVAPMKVVNAYIEPILNDAIGKAKNLHGEKPTPQASDEDTLLDHLV